ncbi:hypothetical protein SEA_WALTZ_51 [Arthrobacter phage Waltz]|nr:hypothetical protein SEA_WALTZ_51 [Arthrobacter phage Waltz]
MQINIHNFTLTTGHTATIMVTASDESIKHYPKTVLKTLATVEALDLTGYEWEATEVERFNSENYMVYMNKA